MNLHHNGVQPRVKLQQVIWNAFANPRDDTFGMFPRTSHWKGTCVSPVRTERVAQFFCLFAFKTTTLKLKGAQGMTRPPMQATCAEDGTAVRLGPPLY
jgi:hypothetical protein